MKRIVLILLAFLSFTAQAQFVVFTIGGGPSTQGAADDSTLYDNYYATVTFKLGSTGVVIAEIDTSDVAALTDTIRFYITGSDQPTPYRTIANASIDTSLKVGTAGVVWDSIVLVSGEIRWYSGGNGKNVSEVIYTTPNTPTTLTISSPDSDTLTYIVSNFSSPANGTVSDSCAVRWDTAAIPTAVTDGYQVYLGDTTVAETDFFIDMDDSLKVYVTTLAKNDGPLGTGTWSTATTDSVFIDSTGVATTGPLMTNVTAYYDFDEASGNLLDQVGSIDGTSVSVGYENANAVLGTSYDFDGSGADSVKFGTNFNFADTFSVSLWVETDLYFRNIIGQPGLGWSISTIGNGYPRFSMYRTGGTNLELDGSSTLYATASLNHLVVINTTDSAIMYLNGVHHASVAYSLFLNNTVETIIGQNGGNSLNGQLDELAIFDGYCLSKAQVEYLYNSGSGEAYPFTGESIPFYMFLLLFLRRKKRNMKFTFLLTLLIIGLGLNAQISSHTNLLIKDSIMLGTSTNAMWSTLFKANTDEFAIVEVETTELIMDGNPYDFSPPASYDPAKFYVDVTLGNDANSGTNADTAWQTLAYAESNATTAGDTIFLKRGEVWALDNVLDINSGGSVGSPIVWDGDSWGVGAQAIIRANSGAGGAPAYGSLVHIAGCDYVTLQNITIDGNDQSRNGLTIGGNHDAEGPTQQNDERFITIQDCDFIDVGDGSDYRWALLSQTWNNDMYNITVQRCTFDGVDNHSIAFYNGRPNLGATLATAHNSLIAYNTVTNSYERGAGGGGSIMWSGNHDSLIVEHNTITQGATGLASGINSDCDTSLTQDKIYIRYNDVRMNTTQALYIQGRYTDTAGTITYHVYYNKFYSDTATSYFGGGTSGVVFIGNRDFNSSSSLEFYNNVVDSRQAYCNIFNAQDNGNLGFLNMRNNIIYNRNGGYLYGYPSEGAEPTTHTNNIYNSSGITYGVITGGVTRDKPYVIDTWEVSSDTADVSFTNTSTYNYHLQTGSGGIDFGTDLGLTPDFEGVVVPDPPNAGILETTEDP